MLGVAAMAGIALTPPKFRDPIWHGWDVLPDDWEKAHAVVRNQSVALLSRT